MANAQETTRILRRLLASGMTARAERLLARMRPADRGPVLSGLTPPEIRTVIDLLYEQHRAASTLVELPPELLPQIFESLGDERVAQILSRAELDDMVELVEWLDESRRDAVIEGLPEERRAELRKAELYPPSSAGRVMITKFVALGEDMTVEAAIERIREAGDDESILYLYVVDEKLRLRGVVPIRRLVAARPERRVGELMLLDPIAVRADADQEEVAQTVGRYNLLAVPVTDRDGRMLGVITVDDVIDVITEEATEDMYHLAGLSEEDRVFSPAHTSISKRMPWMLVNLATAFLAAWVVGLFERTLEQVVALAIFMPVVAGMGGNGGIQALTVITRGIALGEIEFSSGVRAALKELVVGIVIGAFPGSAAAGVAYATVGGPVIGFALFAAMVVTMASAGLMGAAVPLLLKAVRLDPALGAGVIVTTFTDVFAFFSFLGIGTLLLDRMV